MKNKFFGILILLFAAVSLSSQTVLISGASNPYFKYNLRVNDTLFWKSTTVGASSHFASGGLRFLFSGTQRVVFGSTGSISVSDNNVFNQQLILNLSHDASSQDGGINSTTYGSVSFGNTFTGRLAGGTGAAPTATPYRGRMAELTGKGYTGAAFSVSNTASISLLATQTYSLSGQGARIVFQTTKTGSATLSPAFVIEENGSAGITTRDSLREDYPVLFDTSNARWFEISTGGSGADAGIFMHNSTYTKGLDLWLDNGSNTIYFDNIQNNAASITQFRARTVPASFPVNVFHYDGAGKMYLDQLPTNNNNDTILLAQDASTGEVQYRSVSSLGIPVVENGQYTPTAHAISNVDSSTTNLTSYSRVDSVVTVFGKLSVRPTSKNVLCTISITLPVASQLTNDFELTGLVNTIEGAGVGQPSPGVIFAETGNDEAQFNITFADNVAQYDVYFSFQYVIF